MSKHELTQRNTVIALAAIAVVVVALLASNLRPFTLLSISQVYVEQTGGPVGTNPTYWTNSFWIVTGLADMVESYVMFNSQVSNMSGKDYIGFNHLVPLGSIKVTIKPQAPYFTLPLTPESWTIYPETYGRWENAIGQSGYTSEKTSVRSPTVWNYRPGASGSWTLHTPFDVTVEKLSGKNLFSSTQTIDVVGGTGTLIISNPSAPSEQLKVLDLGKLTTGLNPPSSYSTIAILGDTAHAFAWDQTIEKDVKYDSANLNNLIGITDPSQLNVRSFGDYWFGSERTVEGQPKLQLYDSLRSGFYNTQPSLGTVESHPIAADLFNDVTGPNVTPSPGLSVFNWLRGRGHASVNLDNFGQGVSIDPTTNMLKVMAAYGSAKGMYQLRISTELVDTIVYQEPNVACKFIESSWEQGGGKSLQILDTAVAKYVVQNLGTTEASIQVKLNYPNAPVQILPADLITKPILPSQTATFEFLIKNANTGTQEFAGSLTAQAISAGEVKDTDTSLSYTLPIRTGQATTLSLRLVEKGTTTGIGNLRVMISWTGPAMSGYTDANGAVSFQFNQAVSGNVILSTEETDIWKPLVQTLTLAGGLNSYTLQVERKGVEYTDWTKYIIIGTVVVITIMLVVYIVKKQRKTKPRKR